MGGVTDHLDAFKAILGAIVLISIIIFLLAKYLGPLIIPNIIFHA